MAKDFHLVKVLNAMLAHQSAHQALQQAAEGCAGVDVHSSKNLRCLSRRKLYEQQIVQLLRLKQQPAAAGQSQIKSQLVEGELQQQSSSAIETTDATTAAALAESESPKMEVKEEEEEASGSIIIPIASSSSSVKGSLYFSIPRQNSSATKRSRESILVPKKTGADGTTVQFFIRRQRQPPLKKRKSSAAAAADKVADPALKRQLASIPHLSTFDRGLFLQEIVQGQERRLKAGLERTLEPASQASQKGGEKAASKTEQQASSQVSGSNDSAATSSASSSPAREPVLAVEVMAKATAAANSESTTPVSSACHSPVKIAADSVTTTAPKVTFELTDEKEQFIRALDLIPAEEYEELFANRTKSYRKRRTTANPQFSSAALEAKRQTKMEIIAERKNRRQQERALKSSSDIPAATSATSARIVKHEDDVGASGGLQANNPQAMNPTVIISKPGGKKPLFSDNKAKNNFKIENKQVFPGLYLVKRITRGNYPCSLCSEPVQCALDTVLVCKRCSVFFHLNCALTSKGKGGKGGKGKGKGSSAGRVRLSQLVGYELACPGCGGGIAYQGGNGSTTSSQKDDAQEEEEENRSPAEQSQSRLADLLQYTHSLGHSTEILGSLCLLLEDEANQLRLDCERMETLWAKMVAGLDERLFSVS